MSSIVIDGSVLRELREDRLWSQADLASYSCEVALAEGDRQCGITRETVSKLERGSRAPGRRTLRYLVKALRPGMADLRRLLDREPPQALADLARAEAQETAGLPVAPTPSLDASERIARVLGRSVRIDDPLLDALRGRTGRICGAASGIAPGLLIQPAVTHLGTVERLHGCSMTPSRRQRLHAIAADAAALVGWLYWLMSRHAEARDTMALARRLAADSGDDTAQARVLGLMSWMSSTIPTAGRRGATAAAVALAAQASLLGYGAPPADRSWLAERYAVEQAAAGRAAMCWPRIDAARRIAREQGLVEHPAGFFSTFLATRRVAGLVGLCHTLLGQPQQAQIELARALDEVDPSDLLEVTALLSDLALAYTLSDEPEPASRSAIEAVCLARIGGFPLNVERIHGVRDLMPDNWVDLSCIKDLDEHLA